MRRHSRPWGPISTLILGLAFAGSCFFYKGYPREWPPLETHTKQGCWQILGTYSDEGVTSGKKPQGVSLSQILLTGGLDSWNADYAAEGMSVKIAKLSEDTLEISNWKDGQQLSARTFSHSKKEFSCTSKGLTIPQGRTGYGGEGFEVGASWMHLNLAVNKEGSLVIEGVESEVGAFIIIPVVGGSSCWAVFKRRDEADH